MAGRNKHEEASILERRKRVADFYLRGWSQFRIGQEIGVDRAQVSRDLKAVRQEWQEAATMAMDARKAQELAKIDALELVAWGGWEKSCQDAETRIASSTRGRADKKGKALPDLEKSSKVMKGQAGDPRFLERVGWCIDKRCQILGLDVVAKGGAGAPLCKIYFNFNPQEALCPPSLSPSLN